MKEFTHQDVSDYYDQTEVHFRMFWKLEKSHGLHYGVWDKDTKSTEEAILNLNKHLMEFGDIYPSARVLDAGCGIGGSSIFLAKKLKCRATGITLSQKQVDTANRLAKEKNLADLCDFKKCSYTDTDFEDNTFDFVWAIESLGTAQDKAPFFVEMNRILKPGGKILIADYLKPEPYDISTSKEMQTMLNGWAISDIQSVAEIQEMAKAHNFVLNEIKDIGPLIQKSINRMYYAAWFGMFGTKLYNLFKNASPFSKIHYRTGWAQKKAYQQKKWSHYMVSFQKKLD